MKFIIRPQDKDQGYHIAKLAIAGVKAMAQKAAQDGKIYEVKIEEWSPSRTDAQRNTMWMWHGEVAGELSVRTGKKWDKDAVHELVFITRFMPLHDDDLIDTETGEVLPPRRKRTSDATLREISEAMDRYLGWIIEMGIDVTVPSEKTW